MTWLGQNNPAWADKPLGEGGATIGADGCYLTGYTNVANISLNHQGDAEIDVWTMNQILIGDGRFVDSDLLTDRALDGLLGCSYVGTENFPVGPPTDLNWFSDDPNVQDLMEIFIHNNPNETHFVLFYSGHTDADFMVVDSEDGVVKNLDVYGTPSQIIQKGIRYSIPAVPSPDVAPVAPPVPVPAAPEPSPASVDSAPSPADDPSSPAPVLSPAPSDESPAVSPQPSPAPVPPVETQTPSDQPSVTTEDSTPTSLESQVHTELVRIGSMASKLTSRKFWIAVVAAVGFALHGDTTDALTTVLGYLGVQGTVDATQILADLKKI
jgi:hypothetical protein